MPIIEIPKKGERVEVADQGLSTRLWGMREGGLALPRLVGFACAPVPARLEKAAMIRSSTTTQLHFYLSIT
jgi:hypothetical protein